MRGPGDFFGTRQHGISAYDIQNFSVKIETIRSVQSLSEKILKKNPSLEGNNYSNLKNAVMNLFKDETIVFN